MYPKHGSQTQTHPSVQISIRDTPNGRPAFLSPERIAAPVIDLANGHDGLLGRYGRDRGGRRAGNDEFNLSHPGPYRFQLDSAISIQMKKWLSLEATLGDRYISYPPIGLKANDLLLLTGLRVIWGKGKK